MATIKAGRAVIDGVEHVMRLARPGPRTARHRGLNSNHQIRVWCECMAQQIAQPGSYSERPASVVIADPRRLGGWDDLGVVDVRDSGAALALFRAHIEEVARR